MSRHISKRHTAGMVAIMVACIAGAGAYAFTASNTVSAHSAGVGEATVTGYTVNPVGVGYTYSLDGLYVQAVTFKLTAAASDVAASVAGTAGTTTWVDCGATGALFAVTCNFMTGTEPAGGGVLASGPLGTGLGWPIATATKLTVAAVEGGVVTLGMTTGSSTEPTS